MSTKTQIANKTMIDLGEALFSDVDTDATNPADIFNAAWDVALPEMLNEGPEKGWKFAQETFNCIQRQSSSITVFADYSGTVTGTVLATDTTHPYLSGNKIVISDGSVGSYDGEKVITKVDANSYYFTADFVSTETATAKWTSEKFNFRFARPKSTRVVTVSVGGIELTDWDRKSGYIVTNMEDTEVDMDYVLHADDVTIGNFPPHFVDVMWRKMGACLAFDLVQNLTLQNTKIDLLERIYLPRAIGMDNREVFVKEDSDSWTAAGRTTTFIE